MNESESSRLARALYVFERRRAGVAPAILLCPTGSINRLLRQRAINLEYGRLAQMHILEDEARVGFVVLDEEWKDDFRRVHSPPN